MEYASHRRKRKQTSPTRLVSFFVEVWRWRVEIFFGGFFVGIMFTGVISIILHNRELKRMKDDPEYLNYVLGDSDPD